jgi:hypothetical protein
MPRKTKRRAMRKRNMASVGDKPMLNAINPYQEIRKYCVHRSAFNSTAGGQVATFIDLSGILASNAEFLNMQSVYQRIRISRIHVEYVPILFTLTSGAAQAFASQAIAYAPNDYTVPGSVTETLQAAVSLLGTSDKRASMSFLPKLASGVAAPVPFGYFVANTLGSLRLYSDAGVYPAASGTTFSLVIHFETMWSYGE